MFDRDGIKKYVGGNAGNSYSAGLAKIERDYPSVDIDFEYDKDECFDLLLKLEKAKKEPIDDKNEKHKRQDNYSHLKKYICFMRYKRFIHWLSEQPQKNDPSKKYSPPTVRAAAECLHKTLSSLSVYTYNNTDCFSINNAMDFKLLYDSCYEAAKEYDVKNGHRDFRNGLDFYLEYLQGGYNKVNPNPERSTVTERKKDDIGNKYWPSLEEYNPQIDKDTWVKVLNNSTITTTANLAMLKMILEQGGESTCANLAERYGNTYNYYNKLGSSFGEKVKNELKCPDCIDKGRVRFFPISFVGRNVVENGFKRYSWKLRNELREALEEMDLSNINLINNDLNTDVPKNTILYGPPGTGKTYNSVLYAVAIVEKKAFETIKAESYEEVLDRYNEYKANGLVEFTTFHQSYGYEEFIEGIKPVLQNDDDDQSDIQYEIAAGLFKTFCDKAGRPVLKQQKSDIGLNSSPTVWKVSLEGTGDNPTRFECMNNEHIRIGYDSYGESISDDTNFINGGKNVVNAFTYRMKIGDVVLSCYSATTIDAIGVITGDYEWHDEYDHYKRLRKVKWIVKGIKEDITSINNGYTLKQSTVYRLNIALSDVMDMIAKNDSATMEVSEKKENYVFIIDEINRGNISKIFGELITLIEPSKRIGQLEGMKVRLPYSQQFFGVPDNVYLIGTMNTADRSIATIDTALRRRFKFKEMMPDADVLEGVSVEDLSIKEMLIRMNNKISILYDREHTIGHAYFVPLRANPTIENLASIFIDNIIPLLQEYFYEDYEKIRLVLGDNKKEKEEEQFIIAKPNDYNELFGDIEQEFDETSDYEINYSAFNYIESYHSI